MFDNPRDFEGQAYVTETLNKRFGTLRMVLYPIVVPAIPFVALMGAGALFRWMF